jgi:hypothetical protein
MAERKNICPCWELKPGHQAQSSGSVVMEIAWYCHTAPKLKGVTIGKNYAE